MAPLLSLLLLLLGKAVLLVVLLRLLQPLRNLGLVKGNVEAKNGEAKKMVKFHHTFLKMLSFCGRHCNIGVKTGALRVP
jgi:hypothetical protein